MNGALRVRAYLGAVRGRLRRRALAAAGLSLLCGATLLLALALAAGAAGLLRGSATAGVQAVLLLYAGLALAALVGAVHAVSCLGLTELAACAEGWRPALQGRLSAAAWLLQDPQAPVAHYMARRCVEHAAEALGASRPPAGAGANLRPRAALAVLLLAGFTGVHLLAPELAADAWSALAGRAAAGPSAGPPAGGSPPRLGPAEVLYRFPDYTGREARQRNGTGDLSALAGSVAQVRFTVRGAADGVQAATQDGRPLVAALSGDHRHVTVEVPVERDGGYSVSLSGTQSGSRRQVFLVRAQPDAVPTVRILEPAGDLELPRNPRAVQVTGVATDDFDVQSVQLRYLVTAGSGESYRFQEGSLPLQLLRDGDSVRVHGRLAVDQLLGGEDLHGGVLSYYLEAADTNLYSGPGIGVSETLLIRVPGDESQPLDLAGLPLAPLEERLSQRQILEDTRRLHARRPQLEAEVLGNQARVLAARQGELRSSFAALSEQGGDWGHAGDHDEDTETPVSGVEIHLHSSEELPYAPQVLQALTQAVAAMYRAELQLHLADTAEAMEAMQEAIWFLQQARRADRLLFRALPVQVLLDPTARGAGDLDGVGQPPALQPPSPPEDPRGELLRRLRLALQASKAPSPGELQDWSQQALALDGAPEVASALARAANATAEQRVALLRKAAGLLVSTRQRADPVAAAPGPFPDPLADHYFEALGGAP